MNLNSKEEKKCRDAYEAYRKMKLGLKNFNEYKGWRECWRYRNELKKIELDKIVDDLYINSIEHLELTDEELNDLKQTEYMRKQNALK
jgi:hypothetical protein